jgi:hypothetical protein
MSAVRFLIGYIPPIGDSFAVNDFQTLAVGSIINLNQGVITRGDVHWEDTVILPPR